MRSVFYIFTDPAQILAQNTNPNKLNTSYKQDGNIGTGPTGNSVSIIFLKDGENDKNECKE